MIAIDIPGYGHIGIKHLVCDYSGTLSTDGIMVDGVREHLYKLVEHVAIHILTADTHGKVESELEGIRCNLVVVKGEGQDAQKEAYIRHLGPQSILAIGNGNNDRKMLAAARIGIAVCLKEGVSADAMKSAAVMVPSPNDALDLLLFPNRLRATLRNA
jgi:soluble P-type ATPase